MLLIKLTNMECHYDPNKWGGSTTMKVAHNWIANEANWSELVSGQVIDVEFLTGKREAPKRSEAEIWK